MADFFGTNGNDTLVGTPGSDVLEGFAGNDSLIGGGGVGMDFSDEFYGGLGNDTIRGSSGSYVIGGQGNDLIDGRMGYDQVAYSDSPNGVTVNLVSGIAQDGFGTTDTLIAIEMLRGSAFGDLLIGDSSDNQFRGLSGADTINGGGGFDRVRYDGDDGRGGTGAVNVDLAGNVALDPFGFFDTLTGIEAVRGTIGNDTLLGDSVGNQLQGRNGDDLINGRGGNDDLDGEAGNDTLIGGDGGDELDGGDGNDRIEVGRSDPNRGDTVIGSLGNDTVIYTGVSNGGDGSNDLTYHDLTTRIDVFIAPTAASVEKYDSGSVLVGTDTLVDVARVLADVNDGFAIFGTDQDDFFTVDGGVGSWMRIIGGEGSDNYVLNLSGTVRLNFSGSYNNLMGATQGLDINLATGVIANDGFGNVESLSVVAGTSRLEIAGTLNADTISGSARDEIFITQGGNDTIDGEGGYDVVRYNRDEATSAVNVNLTTSIATGSFNGAVFTQRLFDIEEIRGTFFSDTMTGSSLSNTLEGREGDDTLSGGASRDFLFGGQGNDSLVGGLGDDILGGGDGNDTLDGSADLTGFGDYIRPGLGTNTIIGSQTLYQMALEGIGISYGDLSGVGGMTILVGVSGFGTARSGIGGLVNDTFTWTHRFQGSQDADNITVSSNSGIGYEAFSGYAGNDTINGGNGYDLIDYNSEEDEHFNDAVGIFVNLQTGVATDTYGDTDTLTGIEGVRGTHLADRVIARNAVGELLFNGYAGADTLVGSILGFEVIRYDDDVLEGGMAGILANLALGTIRDPFGAIDTVSSIDAVRGTDVGDTIIGATLGEALEGRGGNDSMTGGAGNDTLEGGDGNDTASGGADNDQLFGGFGFDTLNGDVGNDSLDGGGQADALYGGDGQDTLIGGQGFDIVSGGSGNDTLSGGTEEDWMFGGIDNDTVDGGAGNDFLFGGLGFDTVFGGLGNDQLNGEGQADALYGDAGNDTLFAGQGFDIVSGGTGNDQIFGGTEEDWMFGGLNEDSVDGGTGNDFLHGGLGNDSLNGGDGNDQLMGEGGIDRLTGGLGNDTFVFNSTIGGGFIDQIVDFNPVDDTIRLDDAFFAGLAGGALAMNAFVANATGLAVSVSDRIIYRTDTGGLFFDADGTGGVSSVQFASLSASLTLTHADFFVF